MTELQHDATRRPKSRFAAGTVEVSAIPISAVDEPQSANGESMDDIWSKDSRCAGCGKTWGEHFGQDCPDNYGTFVESKHVERVEPASAPASALDRQVAGDHYKKLKIQPVEFITQNGLGFLEGCIVKRITRWRDKDGFQDLEKIKHEVDLLIEMERRKAAGVKGLGHG